MDELKVSALGDVVLPSKLVSLPDPQQPLVIRIRYKHAAEIIAIMGGLPAFTEKKQGSPTIADTQKVYADGQRLSRELAQEIILEPEFTYGEQREPGKAWWGDLTDVNQMGLVAVALEFAGIKAEVKGVDASEEAAAASVGSFSGGEAG